ncbi:unnamed protein product, partial [Effrenium voratum]
MALRFRPPGRAEPQNALHETLQDMPWSNSSIDTYLRSRGFDRELHEGRWPQLEIVVHHHEEEFGHTWYRLDCAISFPGAERYVWHTSKRLVHFRERLHDRVKEELSPEDYARHFAAAPFARAGGLLGTTKRLDAWCVQLARSASEDELPRQLLVLVLCFIDAPRYIAGALPFCMDRSLERLAHRIEDKEWFVRYTAVQAVAQIADTGDPRVTSALIDMLADKEAHVRSAAVESLSEVAFKYDRAVHKTLGSCLEDANPLLREAAAQALALVTDCGDEYVCLLLEAHLDDPDFAVKRAVRESLTLLGQEDLR